MKKLVSSLIVVCLLTLSLLGCATNPVTGRSELMLVSEEQEIKMGRDLYPNALWGAEGGGGPYRDDQLRTYLTGVVRNIHGVSHRPNLPVDFAVQNSSVPNAWAIPGHVVMTRGLLAGLDNEAEFAFVMGHEMGHVAARHSARQTSYGMLQQIGLAAAGTALGGQAYSDALLNAGAIGSSLLLLKYGRDDELEADRLGIQYMTRLGYDPENAVRAHQNLDRISQDYLRSIGKEPQERGFFEDLLSTHPRTSVRIDEIRQMIAAVPPYVRVGDGTGKERFQRMSADIRKTNKVYRDHYDPAARAYQKNSLAEAERHVDGAIAADRTEAPFPSLKGYIMLKKKDYASADRFFTAALNIDNAYQPALRGMGISQYFRGNYGASVENLKRALSLFPEDASSHYFLGMSRYRTKAYREAIPHLKKYAEANPKHPEIFGVLGICYENTGDQSSAYQAYSLQVKVAPDNEMGKHAASRIPAIRQ